MPQEIFKSLQPNSTLSRDEEGIFGMANLIWNAEVAFGKQEIGSRSTIDYQRAIELSLTDICITSTQADEDQLEFREEHTRAGNVNFGGRGGPYKNEDQRSYRQRKREMDLVGIDKFDSKLRQGSLKVRYVVGNGNASLKVELPKGALPLIQGTSELDILFPMSVHRQTELESGETVGFRWDQKFGFVVEKGEFRVSLFRDLRAKSFFHRGAIDSMIRVYCRIRG
jgi:hypothetical protein